MGWECARPVTYLGGAEPLWLLASAVSKSLLRTSLQPAAVCSISGGGLWLGFTPLCCLRDPAGTNGGFVRYRFFALTCLGTYYGTVNHGSRDKEAVHCMSTNHGAPLRNWVLLIRGRVARKDDVQHQNNAENPLNNYSLYRLDCRFLLFALLSFFLSSFLN